ncbi:MAG TPA: MBL fold metallo-hydrolase [Chloroflexota bacterium]
MLDPLVEVLPQVYRLGFVLGGRPVYQYLLVGDRRALLVDTGITDTPREVILPALDRLGVDPTKLQFAVITHCDLDHQGGAHQLKTLLPHVLLSCGDLDRPLVEDPEALLQQRYDAYRAEHDLGYDPPTLDWIRRVAGRSQPMDLTWTTGETVRLGDDWVVRLLQMPGHSLGHLVVHDLKHHAAYTGDAVHHLGYRTVEGQMAMPPTYLEVESYLHTVRHLASLGLHALLGAHWPVAQGAGVQAFLDETRRYVELADRGVRGVIQSAAQGVTLREIVATLNQQLGDWPEAAGIDLVFSLAGHVRHLERLGLVAADRSTRPVRFRWVGPTG